MDTNERRENILIMLTHAEGPLSATAIASKFKVSRQIVVGDVALLRAAGHQINSTPRGYLLRNEELPPSNFEYVGLIACKHDSKKLKEELYLIVDLGGCVIDVSIEHSIYGQLSGSLDIRSRYDADQFVARVEQDCGTPLSALTDGIHLHHIGCRDKETFLRISVGLQKSGIALE